MSQKVQNCDNQQDRQTDRRIYIKATSLNFSRKYEGRNHIYWQQRLIWQPTTTLLCIYNYSILCILRRVHVYPPDPLVITIGFPCFLTTNVATLR